MMLSIAIAIIFEYNTYKYICAGKYFPVVVLEAPHSPTCVNMKMTDMLVTNCLAHHSLNEVHNNAMFFGLISSFDDSA